MTDLDDRLRTRVTALAERAEPKTNPNDVIAALGRGSRRSPRIGLRVAAAAAVVLVVVAAVALVRREEHQPTVDVGPATTTGEPQPEWHPTSLSPGWHALPEGPLGAGWPFVMASSSRELFVFGVHNQNDITENHGYAYAPATGAWTDIAPSPLSSMDGLNGMFDGESLVIWSKSGAAFWNPESRTWREGTIPPRPLSADIRYSGDIGHAGADLIYWTDDLAYNMQRDEWRDIARPPSHPDRARAAFDGYELVVAGYDLAPPMAFDPTNNTWRELPPSGLSGNALDLARRPAVQGSGRDDEIVGVDYLGYSVAYYRPTNSWRPLGTIPLQTGEDIPQIVDLGPEMILAGYIGFALLDDNDRWHPVAQLHSGGRMAPMDGAVFVVGAEFAVYVP